MAEVRVLIVDDQEPFRRAMGAVVEETDGFVVVGSATSGEESLVAAAELRPELVLMDVNLPGIDGIEATRRLTSGPDGPVVIDDNATIGTSASATITSSNSIAGAVNNYDGTYGEFTEEFLYRSAPTNGSTNGFWTCIASGTSAACGTSNMSSVSGRPGMQRFTTGTTSTGAAIMQTSQSAFTPTDGTYANKVIAKITTLSTSSEGLDYQTGFSSSPGSISYTDGCTLTYDERNVLGANASNTHNLVATCCKAGVCQNKLLDGSTVCDGSFTSVATAIAASTWIGTDVRMSPTEVDFYANDGSGWTKRCQITNSANIPTASVGWVNQIIKNVGTAARTIDFDFAQLRWTLTTARTNP